MGNGGGKEKGVRRAKEQGGEGEGVTVIGKGEGEKEWGVTIRRVGGKRRKGIEKVN